VLDGSAFRFGKWATRSSFLRTGSPTETVFANSEPSKHYDVTALAGYGPSSNAMFLGYLSSIPR